MPQTGTGWTQYHDFLMQQAIAMMAEPDWANNPALMEQLTQVQDELQLAGASLGDNDAEIKGLFDDFQTAYQDGVRQNETRYGQLLADSSGNTPTVFNSETGRWEQNASYQAPLSYNQRIDDLTGTGGVYDQAQSRFDAAGANQNAALTGAVQNRFDTRAGDTGSALSGTVGAYQGAYNDPGGILSSYDQRESDLKGLLTGYGNIQRDDLNRQYDSFAQQQQAQLHNAGLGNSTVLSSVLGGVETERQLDRARLEDQLRREQLGYQGQWSGETLGARQGYADSNLNAGFDQAQINAGVQGEAANAAQQSALAQGQMDLTGAGYAGQVADVRNQLTADPLRAIEARTDISPSLGDVYNAGLNVGTSQSTQFALPGMAPTSYYQQQPANGAA